MSASSWVPALETCSCCSAFISGSLALKCGCASVKLPLLKLYYLNVSQGWPFSLTAACWSAITDSLQTVMGAEGQAGWTCRFQRCVRLRESGMAAPDDEGRGDREGEAQLVIWFWQPGWDICWTQQPSFPPSLEENHFKHCLEEDKRGKVARWEI